MSFIGYIIERGNVMGKAGKQLGLRGHSCFVRRILGWGT